MRSLRVALIGYGYAGATFHAPLISAVEGLHLCKIASSDPQKVHHDWPGIDVMPTPDALFGAPDVDLVVLATPNATHFPLARAALSAGKHVVVDKPFVLTSGEAEELMALAEEKSRLLSVFHNRRWDNDFLTVKQLMNAGILGEIHTYEARFDRYRPEVRKRWREQDLPGSGSLYDLGSHLIDQALQLFGLPRSIFAVTRIQRPGGRAVDYFHLVLDYPAVQAILHSGALVRQGGPRFQIHGSKGSFLKSGMDPQEGALKLARRPGDPSWGRDPEELYGEVSWGTAEQAVTEKMETVPGAYQAFYEGIYSAITAGTAPPVSALEARHVIRVIECALQSSREKSVIPFIP
jgi:predicted dehydrogenase